MENDRRERSTILIIDDDARLCRLIAEFFSDAEYDVQAVHHGAAGLAKALDESFDLILLDVMLLTGRLRSPHAIASSIFGASDYADGARRARDCVKGLNAGADDYLAKPSVQKKLAARIGAVLRRTRGAQNLQADTLSLGRLRLNAASGASGWMTSLSTLRPRSSTYLTCWPDPVKGCYARPSLRRSVPTGGDAFRALSRSPYQQTEKRKPKRWSGYSLHTGWATFWPKKSNEVDLDQSHDMVCCGAGRLTGIFLFIGDRVIGKSAGENLTQVNQMLLHQAVNAFTPVDLKA